MKIGVVVGGWMVTLGLVGGVACQKDSKKTSQSPAASTSQTSAAAVSAAAASASMRAWLDRPAKPMPTAVTVPKATRFNIPVGPAFGVLPGKGMGPIRFGATIETIERLMDAPCKEKTKALCRYTAQSVEFYLTEGVLSKIHIHGDERTVTKGGKLTYGIFNGLLSAGVRLGMYRKFVVESLGEPDSSREVKPGRFQTERIDHYDGLKLEYDQLKNENVVLAGIVVVPSATADKAWITRLADAKKAILETRKGGAPALSSAKKPGITSPLTPKAAVKLAPKAAATAATATP